MRDIKNKVKVFISSRECGTDGNGDVQYERYRFIRRAIKEILEETNMAKVYVREIDGGGSSPLCEMYLNEIDDSDLCVFIIDNHDDKDMHSSGVIKEHERAKKERKCLYFFCNENEIKPTQIEGEIRALSTSMYVNVHAFDDIPSKVYCGVIDDIFRIYHDYCRNRLKYIEDEKDIDKFRELETTETAMRFPETSFPKQPNEKNFSGAAEGYMKLNYDSFNSLTNEVVKLLNIFNPHFTPLGKSNPLPQDNDFDKVCTQLFKRVICIEKLDNSIFSLMEREIFKSRPSVVCEILKHRIQAIQKYFSGDLQSSMDAMKKAYENAVDNTDIPNWLLLDILIDCRNISIQLAGSKGHIEFKNEWSELIESNSETVHYPMLDRYVAQHFLEVAKFSRSKEINDPNVNSVGNNSGLYIECMNAFAIAVSNASLTQMLCVKERLIESLSALCRLYSDHDTFVSLIGLLLINNADKDLDKHIKSLGYSQNISLLNESDISKFADKVSLMPIEYIKKNSFVLLFKHFGYYFSDIEYKKNLPEFLRIINERVEDKRFAVFAESRNIIESVQENVKRIDANRVVDFVVRVIKKRTIYTENAIKILNYIDHNELSHKTKTNLCDTLLDLSKKSHNEQNSTDKHSFRYGLLIVRKTLPEFAVAIDKNILEYHKSYYNTSYALEFDLPDENGNPVNQIQRLIAEARFRNEAQGKNGIYMGYTDNPLATLSNIVGNFVEKINKEDIADIVMVAKDTLFTSTQEYSAKITAVELLLRVCNIFGLQYLDECKNNINKLFDEITIANEGWGGRYSKFILECYLIMLLVRLGDNHATDLLTIFTIPNLPDDVKIRICKALYDFSHQNSWNGVDPSSLFSILQFALSNYKHKNNSVRLFSTRTLFELIRTEYHNLVCEQLSLLIDVSDSMQTYEIVFAIKQSEDVDDKLKEYIMQKAKASNHYLVRKEAEEK